MSTKVVVEEPPMKMASLKDARAVIEKVGAQIRANSLTLHTRLKSLVWVLLQKLKGLFGVPVLEVQP